MKHIFYVEQTSTKGISLKFPPMTSVPSTDKSNLDETSSGTITEHVSVQNTAVPIMYTVLVSNIAVNQQQTEITQLAPQPLSATPTLMQANPPVSNLQYFQLPNLSSNPAVPLAVDSTPNSVHFEQDQILLHPRKLLPENVGDLDNQENFDPSSCQIVTGLNEDRDR